jgi:hypothetical protein
MRFAPSGTLEAGKLGALAAALGTPLSPPEEAEALIALNTSATFHISAEAFSLYWLGAIPPKGASASPHRTGRISSNGSQGIDSGLRQA